MTLNFWLCLKGVDDEYEEAVFTSVRMEIDQNMAIFGMSMRAAMWLCAYPLCARFIQTKHTNLLLTHLLRIQHKHFRLFTLLLSFHLYYDDYYYYFVSIFNESACGNYTTRTETVTIAHH